MYILQVFPEFASILRVFIPIRQKLKSSERIHQTGQIICPLIRKLPRNQTPAPVFPEGSRRIHARPVVEFQHILHLENGNARDRTVCRAEHAVYHLTLVCCTEVISNVLKFPPLTFFRFKIPRQRLIVVRSTVDYGVRVIAVRQMLVETVATERKLNDIDIWS